MNADQGFRRAPGNLLRVAAGAGAAVLIVTAVSAVRRARTAMTDRDSGPAHGSQVSPSAVPVPEVPEAVKACDPAVGQVAISAALLLVSVTALSAVAVRRRGSGKRGASHARTGMTLSRRKYLPTAAIPGSRAPRRAAARIRPGTTPMSPGMTACAPSTRMTTPAGPDGQVRMLSSPTTRAGGEGVLTRAGIARRRPCGRTATPAGPSPWPRRGPTPNRRRRMTVPAGAAAEDPRDKNRRPRLTAARTAGQRGRTLLRGAASLPGPVRLLVQARIPG